MVDNSVREIRSICASLEGAKITERRRKIEELKVLLQNQDTLSALNADCFDGERNNLWDVIFQSAHSVLLQEADRSVEVKDGKRGYSTCDNFKKACAALLKLVVDRANSGGIGRLSCNPLLDSILLVLEDNIYREQFSDLYIGILTNSFIPIKHYSGEVLLDKWFSLLLISKGLFKEAKDDQAKTKLFEIYEYILLNGIRSTEALAKIKFLFKLVVRTLEANFVRCSSSFQLSLYRLISAICRQLNSDCHNAVCSFGEQVIPLIYNIVDKRSEYDDRKEAKFECFEELISCLFPMCQASCKFKPPIALYHTILKEVRHTASLRYSKEVSLPPVLLRLASRMAILLFPTYRNKSAIDISCTNNQLEPGPAKRQRISIGFIPLIEECTVPGNPLQKWPWICLFDAIVRYSPDLMTPEEFKICLKVIADTLNLSSEPIVSKFLRQSALSLLHVEALIYPDLHNVPCEVNAHWSSIWDSTVRAIGLNHLNTGCHEAIIKLMSRIHDAEKIEILMEMYSQMTVQLSGKSLITLISSAGHSPLPTAVAWRSSVMKWCFQWLRGESIQPDSCLILVAQVLFLLSIKSKYKSDLISFQQSSDLLELFRLSEKEFLAATFIQIPRRVTNTSQTTNADWNSNVIVDEIMSVKILVELNSYIDSVVETFNPDINRTFNALSSLAVVVVNFSYFSFKNKLDLHKRIADKTVSIVQLLLEHANVTFLLAASKFFHKVLQLPYLCFNIESKLPQCLEKLLVPLNLKNSVSSDEHLERQELMVENEATLLVNTSKAIISLIEVFSDPARKTKFIIRFLKFSSQCLVTKSSSHFQVCTAMLKGLLNLLNDSFTVEMQDNIIREALSLLKSLCRIWHPYQNESKILILHIKDIFTIVYQRNDDSIKKNYLSLVTALWNLINKNSYCVEVIEEFVNLIGTIVLLDVHFKWFLDDATGSALHFSLILLSFLKNPFNKVRISAIKYIPHIFVLREGYTVNKQMSLFEKLLGYINESFNMKEGLASEDELNNRQHCALGALKSVLVHSLPCRRPSLLSIFKLVPAKNLKQSLVHRALTFAANDMKIADIEIFLNQNLEYILWKWFCDFGTFGNFPYGCLGCDYEDEFLVRYKKFLIPIMLLKDDETGMSKLYDSHDNDKATVLKECYPQIISYILPKLYRRNDVPEVQKMYSSVQEVLGSATTNLLLTENLDLVLFQIFIKLNDPTDLAELCGSVPRTISLPHQFPMNLNLGTLSSTITYLQTTTNQSGSLFAILCSSTETAIKVCNLFFRLYKNIFLAVTPEIRVSHYFQFVVFLDTLISCLGNVGGLVSFFVRHIIHMLLHLMKKSDLCSFAVVYFHRALTAIFPLFQHEILLHTDVILPTLITISRTNQIIYDKVIKILQLLVVEHNVQHSKFLCLPSDPRLNSISSIPSLNLIPLSMLIDDFLSMVSESSDYVSISEAIDLLDNQIMTRTIELEEMYNNFSNSRGFSEDCKASGLHRLIGNLFKLSTIPDTKVNSKAGQCLGLIGPRRLNSLLLYPQDPSTRQSFAETVISLLFPLTVDINGDLIESSVKCLQSLLTFKEGIEAKDNLPSGAVKDYLNSISPRKSKLNQAPSMLMVVNFDSSTMIPALLNLSLDSDSCFSEHKSWIIAAVSSLLSAFNNCRLFQLLVPVVKLKYEVGERLLPCLIILIYQTRGEVADVLISMISNFFKHHFQSLQGSANNSESIFLNKDSIQVMLNVVEALRCHSEHNLLTKSKFNHLHIAMAAQYCSAHATAILYLELCANVWRSSSTKSLSIVGNFPLESVCLNQGDIGKIYQNTLWEAYKDIGDEDAVFGCGSGHLESPIGRVKYYKQLGQWDKLIAECEINSGSFDPVFNQELVYGLRQSGMYSLAMSVSLLSDYNSAWRLSEWKLNLSDASYWSLVYSAVERLSRKNHLTALDYINQARMLLVRDCSQINLQMANNVYQPLTDFSLLRELQDSCEIINSEEHSHSVQIPVESLMKMRWRDVETLLNGRVAASRICGSSLQASLNLLNASRMAIANSSYHIALRWLNSIDSLEVSESIIQRVQLEKGKIFWALGNQYLARDMVKPLLIAPLEENSCLSEALLTYGKWMVESKEESPHSIIHKYFLPASEKSLTKEDKLATSEILARYADDEYQRVTQYVSSIEFINEIEEAKERSKHGEIITQQARQASKMNVSVELSKVANQFISTANIDLSEAKEQNEARHSYLNLAIQSYVHMVVEGEENMKMFRLVSLWQELCDELNSYGSSEILNNCLQYLTEGLSTIQSYKMLKVLPQLVVRLSDQSSVFNDLLVPLLERCCLEHPHHALPHLLAITNSEHDLKISKEKSKPSPCEASSSSETRIIGAKKLQSKLYHKGDTMARLITDMQTLYEAYTIVAYHKVDKNSKSNVFRIPDHIGKIKNFEHVLCPTASLLVNKTGEYECIAGIIKFDDRFSLVGGINAPKKIKVFCTDGSERVQLLKGQDDLRQDALIQQVFSIVNSLFKSNEETSRRKLFIHTYKIVPVSQRSGVIEWCSNTETLGDYLVGTRDRKGAHERFRPMDMSPHAARKLMHLDHEKHAPPEKRIRTYQDICKNLHPVFRYFFFEKYQSPGVWFERRLAYTRSVAAVSIIGYIFGLGDRHVANILLDKTTAEVIHIDFGIAFEFGISQKTPETVPFRLSRDIVDGMGVFGTEGVYRRCCEITMSMIRESQTSILAALEVVLLDPLYMWAVCSNVTPTQPNTSQTSIIGKRDKRNPLAERALKRLRARLQGTEIDGCTSSIEGQVGRLIQQATDPYNLARLFGGWQPYL